MKVLLTGATTPLGQTIASRLLADELCSFVLAVGKESQHTRQESQRFCYRQIDLSRPRRVRELLFGEVRQRGLTTIIHTAQHRRSSDKGERVRQVNVELCRQLLALAEDHPTLRKFVLGSTANIYRVDNRQSNLIGEDHPIWLESGMPQWLRDRIECDVLACTNMGMSDMSIVILRLSEIFAPNMGGQLWDYVQSPVCFRALGFDPMINLLSVDDAANAFLLAAKSEAEGVFNIPGMDTLPLSLMVKKFDRHDISVPGPALKPIYKLRQAFARGQFNYAANLPRFHYGGIVDGHRARVELGYEPDAQIRWP